MYDNLFSDHQNQTAQCALFRCVQLRWQTKCSANEYMREHFYVRQTSLTLSIRTIMKMKSEWSWNIKDTQKNENQQQKLFTHKLNVT